jgi:hypothetical protein
MLQSLVDRVLQFPNKSFEVQKSIIESLNDNKDTVALVVSATKNIELFKVVAQSPYFCVPTPWMGFMQIPDHFFIIATSENAIVSLIIKNQLELVLSLAKDKIPKDKKSVEALVNIVRVIKDNPGGKLMEGQIKQSLESFHSLFQESISWKIALKLHAPESTRCCLQ